jgi:hypothetical protein
MTPAQENKRALLQAFDNDIENAQRVRDFFAGLDAETLAGFNVSGSPLLSLGLIQFHRSNRNVDEPSAKEIARHIGTGWTRDGGDWHVEFAALPYTKVIIHGAELHQPKPEVVEL